MKRLTGLTLALAIGLSACRDETTAPNDVTPHLAQAAPRTLSGWFHIQWGDPRDGRGGSQVRHELVDDSGRTTTLDLDEGALAQAGGALALNRRRVTVDGARAANGRLTVRSLRPDGARPAADAAAGDAAVPRLGAFPYITVACKFADVATTPRPLELRFGAAGALACRCSPALADGHGRLVSARSRSNSRRPSSRWNSGDSRTARRV